MSISKAIAGAVMTAGATLTIAAADNIITGHEWLTILVAGVVSFAGVYAAPSNTPKGG